MVKTMLAVRRLADRALDPIIALVVTTFCLVVTIAIAQDSTDPFNGWTVALIVLIGGSLVFRHRAPEVARYLSEHYETDATIGPWRLTRLRRAGGPD